MLFKANGEPCGLRGITPEEREADRRHQVVRVCVTRSKTTAEFFWNLKKQAPDFAQLADLELTSFMLAEKNKKSHNPGQLMPVGGMIKTDESVATAAARQLFEETHLHPAAAVINLGEMDYQIPGRTDVITEASFVGTKILPTDRPFPINVENDRIGRFHYLTLHQLGELLVLGTKEVPFIDEPVRLLDSLYVPPDKNFAQQSAVEKAAININVTMIDYAQKAEAVKKTSVLQRWFEKSGDFFIKIGLVNKLADWQAILSGKKLPGADQARGVVPNTRNEPDLYAVQWVWRDIFRVLEEKKVQIAEVRAELFKAIDLDNFAETVKENGAETSFVSELEAGLFFVSTLLETYHLDEEYLAIAEESRHLQHLVRAIKIFIERLVLGSGEKKSVGSSKQLDLSQQLTKISEKLNRAATPDNQGITDEVESAFCKAFALNRADLSRKLKAIDQFLDNLVKNAIIPAIQGQYSSNLIDQNNEIRHADLSTLLRKAFPTAQATAQWKTHYRSPNDRRTNALKSVIFEARRKLVLLALLSSAEEHYRGQAIMHDTVVENLYRDFVSGPNYHCNLQRLFDPNAGDLLDVRVEIVHSQDSAERENFAYDDYAQPEPYSALRRVVNKTGGVAYFCDISKPETKTWESFARKILERGLNDSEEIHDIFRRAITLAAVDTTDLTTAQADAAKTRLYQRETRTIANVFITNEHNEHISAGPINDVGAVLDIIEQLAKQPNVRLIHYKPTPLPGERIQSRSCGGTNNRQIRYAKFYLEHTLPNGSVRYEEVHIYSPGENGVPSAFYYKTKKEADDKIYFLKRLLRTKGRHAVVDLLWPVGIYGRPIFEAKKRLEERVGQA